MNSSDSPSRDHSLAPHSQCVRILSVAVSGSSPYSVTVEAFANPYSPAPRVKLSRVADAATNFGPETMSRVDNTRKFTYEFQVVPMSGDYVVLVFIPLGSDQDSMVVWDTSHVTVGSLLARKKKPTRKKSAPASKAPAKKPAAKAKKK